MSLFSIAWYMPFTTEMLFREVKKNVHDSALKVE